MKSKLTACFIDFDHTLFNADKFFRNDVKKSFAHFGIDENLWEQTYAAVRETGYSFEKHIKEIQRQSEKKLPVDEMKRVLQKSYSDLKRYLFPDVLPFLNHLKKKGVRLFLISFGDRNWQCYKVSGSYIANYFDFLYFSSKEGKKGDLNILKQIKKFSRIVMIDDNPDELDSIKNIAPKIETYCVSRKSSSKNKLKKTMKLWRYPHIPCNNLNELKKIF